ncbi:hypothetical protein B4916_02460 [Yersinia intermedia]|nr:hypothetical protein B4916_02460 [Yersinia intermedia]
MSGSSLHVEYWHARSTTPSITYRGLYPSYFKPHVVGYALSPESLTPVNSSGLYRLPPSCNSKYLV